MLEEKKSVDWISLITGICFIIVSFIAFKNPYASLSSMVIYFGIIAIVKGVGGVLIYKKIKDFSRLNIKLFFWMRIIDILLGLILVFNVESAVSIIPYVFSIWFIIDSINDISFGRYLRFIPGRLYELNIAINIITLILGIMMLYNPLRASFTVVYLIGVYFTICGVKYIAYAFKQYTKNMR